MSEEWWPWVKHDGKGCPVENGVIVQIEWWTDGLKEWGIYTIGSTYTRESWNKADEAYLQLKDMGIFNCGIIRYRIRKPKGLQILEALLQDLPETVEA